MTGLDPHFTIIVFSLLFFSNFFLTIKIQSFAFLKLRKKNRMRNNIRALLWNLFGNSLQQVQARRKNNLSKFQDQQTGTAGNAEHPWLCPSTQRVKLFLWGRQMSQAKYFFHACGLLLRNMLNKLPSIKALVWWGAGKPQLPPFSSVSYSGTTHAMQWRSSSQETHLF